MSHYAEVWKQYPLQSVQPSYFAYSEPISADTPTIPPEQAILPQFDSPQFRPMQSLLPENHLVNVYAAREPVPKNRNVRAGLHVVPHSSLAQRSLSPAPRTLSPARQATSPIRKFDAGIHAAPKMSPAKRGAPLCSAQQTMSPKRIPVDVVEVPKNKVPKLWALECVFSEGGYENSFNGLKKDARTLVHRQTGRGAPLLQEAQRIGRLFQESFFKQALRERESLELVSREIFQVWAHEMDEGSCSSGTTNAPIACLFFLTVFGGTNTETNVLKTWVNGDLVTNQVQIHNGDSIALTKAQTIHGANSAENHILLEFRFDLSESMLRDAEAAPTTFCHMPDASHMPSDPLGESGTTVNLEDCQQMLGPGQPNIRR
eukprot:gnl/TRDRNA2_/TRDRNA2_129376_c0_seq1.p1 gnl/TRDRNA2_/TRDRNA2_129376_c0~~gnl/TRDRNA2_/TRDRNA2_129376_c0_seq1.p1  ORF type:complete len:407 (-),score=37.56 gnl/TRDRNA2_/TRDRNA2_129376_c0_seq1:149-1267(-)